VGDFNRIKEEQSTQGRLSDSGRFPKVVLIDTVSFCNLRCSMCSHDGMKRKRGTMSMPLFIRIIDEIAETDRDTRVWMVFFGEPLVIKKTTLFPMIRYAKEKGLTDVVVNSNANLMDESAARELIGSGLDAIYIGIDAHTPETYSRVRVGGDHALVVENVRRLIRLKDELGSETPRVYVQFVEMEINREEVAPFTEFWNNEGATVKIRPMVSWAGMVDAPNLRLEDPDRWPCYWAMQTMSITDDGKVVLCAVDLDARFVAGDVNDETLDSVWNGRLKEIRRLHTEGRFDSLPPVCRDCRDWLSARAEYRSAGRG